MKKTAAALWAAGILWLLACAGPLTAQDEFEYHGYIRMGAALNEDMVDATSGINVNLVGRLGNEHDAWVESELVNKFTAEDGSWTKEHADLLAQGKNATLMFSDGNYDMSLDLAQAYVEIGGLPFDPKAVFHIGTKYDFEDIHILDFKWRNLTGTGIGVDGAMDGALSLNLLTGSDITAASIPFTLDARYDILPVLQVEVSGACAKDPSLVTSTATSASNGAQAAVVYYLHSFYGLPIGWMTLAAQAGYGMFGGAPNAVASKGWSALGGLGNLWLEQNSTAFRLVTSGSGDYGQLGAAAGLWAECDKDDLASNPRLVVAGVLRPAWKIDKHFSLVGEGGLSYQSCGASATGLSYKLTLAPTLALDSGVGSRPQLRVFGTYEAQDPKLGYISANGLEDHELKFGIQTEYWW
jgi:maltoporin